jgi:hypothetical protein
VSEGRKDAYHELELVQKRLGPKRVQQMMGRTYGRVGAATKEACSDHPSRLSERKGRDDDDRKDNDAKDDEHDADSFELQVEVVDGGEKKKKAKRRGQRHGLPTLELPPVDIERGSVPVGNSAVLVDLDAHSSASYVLLRGAPSIVIDPTDGAYADGGAHHRHDKSEAALGTASGESSSSSSTDTDTSGVDKDLSDHAADGFPHGFKRAVKGSQASRGLVGKPENVEYMITVVPDVMQTVEALRLFFAPLLRKMPNGRILIVSLPGMPGTTAPPDAILNNEAQAKHLLNLLGQLDASGDWVPPRAPMAAEHDELSGEWTVPPSIPHFLFGVGQGANILTHVSIEIGRGEEKWAQLQKQRSQEGVADDEAKDEEEEQGGEKAEGAQTFFKPAGLHRLYGSARLLMCINPHAHSGHGLSRCFKQLRRLHLAGTASNAEKSTHIAHTMFSPTFIEEWGRKQALAEYFKSRRALQQPETVAGIGQQLRGAAKNVDLRPELLDLTLPLVVYSGANDAFVVPLHTEPFLQAFQAVHREGAGTVSEAELVVTADPSQLVAHFGWLDGGHELLVSGLQL